MLTSIISYNINIIDEYSDIIDKLHLDVLYTKRYINELYTYDINLIFDDIRTKFGTITFIRNIINNYNNGSFLKINSIEVDVSEFKAAKLKQKRKAKLKNII